jgi:hypothetical protein
MELLEKLVSRPEAHQIGLDHCLKPIISLKTGIPFQELFRLIPLLCGLNTHKEFDFVLLWLLIGVTAHIFNARPGMRLLESANTCCALVFFRFHVIYREISETNTITDFVQNFSESLSRFKFADICAFLEKLSILQLKRASSPVLLSAVCGVLACLLNLVQVGGAYILDRLTVQIAGIMAIGKDDCCRATVDFIASRWSRTDLELFNSNSIAQLQDAAIRALIKPSEETRLNCLNFLTKVLSVAPSDVVREEKERLVDTLLRCGEFQPIENMLDAIHAVISCDSEIDRFVSLSPISIPRILTLAVHEDTEVRTKANAILRFVSRASDNKGIVTGLIAVLGMQEVGVLSKFLLDWSSRVDLNKHAIALLGRLYDGIAVDERLAGEFARKVAPILLKHCKVSSGLLQVLGFGLMNKLFSGPLRSAS